MKIKKEKILNKVYNVDSRLILETLPKDLKIRATITSPPYYDMKDYGPDNQVGYGQTYENYLEDLKKIFGSVYKITETDGTLWIIIDTFKRDNQVVTLPFDLSNKLKEIGWLLQDIIIWKKDKTVPWSTNGFMQRKFEYILFFSKSKVYKSNKDNVRVFDTAQLKQWWVKYPERYNPKGKALDEIWEFQIPVQGSWGDQYIRHFCPLPKKMVDTMIQISSDENDIILDPFAGTGTVLSQSAFLKRHYIGFELNNVYINMFEKYLEKTLLENQKDYDLMSHTDTQERFEIQILELRALKFARVLLGSIEKVTEYKNLKIFVSINGKSILKNKVLIVKHEIFGEYIDESNLLVKINDLIQKPPLSKFGIEAQFEFKTEKKLDPKKHFGYTKSNTYSYQKTIDLNSPKIRIVSDIKVDINEKDYI